MLATLFGDGRDTRMGAQGIVISFGKSSAGLGDYCSGYDSPDSRQRTEDRNVTSSPLACGPLHPPLETRRAELPCAGTTTLALLWTRRRRGKSNAMCFRGRLDYARRNLQRERLQCGNDIIRTQAANAVCTQQALDTLGSQALRNAG